MPAIVIETPLGIACVFSDGRRAEFTWTICPARGWPVTWLTGLAELIHPHGTVGLRRARSTTTCRALRSAWPAPSPRRASPAAPPICAAASWPSIWMAGPMRLGGADTRRMLEGFARPAARLGDGVLELAAGRALQRPG